MVESELTNRDKVEHHIRNRLVSTRYKLQRANLPKKAVLISLSFIEWGLRKINILG